MIAIVDVQGFKTGTNNFILKEFAVAYDNRIQVFLYKQPYPFYDLTTTERRQVSWIERNRGIFWKEGHIPYSNHKDHIIPILANKKIYTKGLEKVSWIKEISKNNNVFNLEDQACPNLVSLYDKYSMSDDVYSCIYHSNICALKNVMCLNKWCKENKI